MIKRAMTVTCSIQMYKSGILKLVLYPRLRGKGQHVDEDIKVQIRFQAPS